VRVIAVQFCAARQFNLDERIDQASRVSASPPRFAWRGRGGGPGRPSHATGQE